jgi:hypothetical protein
MGSRHGLWVGAACLLVLAVAGGLALRFGAAPASAPAQETEAVPQPPLTALPPAKPSAVTPPAVVRREPPRPPPRQEPPPPAPAEATEAPAASVPPPEEKVLVDPFEPEGDQDAPIRTLVAVGDIQLGVIRESARIRDEAGLKTALARIGDDLQKRFGKPQEPGAPGPQELLDGYREELGKYMDGMVELSGPGFRIGTEVGPPLPREKWWKPRAQ